MVTQFGLRLWGHAQIKRSTRTSKENTQTYTRMDSLLFSSIVTPVYLVIYPDGIPSSYKSTLTRSPPLTNHTPLVISHKFPLYKFTQTHTHVHSDTTPWETPLKNVYNLTTQYMNKELQETQILILHIKALWISHSILFVYNKLNRSEKLTTIMNYQQPLLPNDIDVKLLAPIGSKQ